ncbi:MAG TPA: hypothetical protein VF476_00415, partial [Chitinophagaceae bacterium]
MYEQLRGLGLELDDGLIIMVFKETSHDQLQWPVFEGGVASDTMFLVPYFDHPVMNEFYKARESGVKFIEKHFNRATKDSFLEKIFTISDHKHAPEEFKLKWWAGSYYHYSFAMEKYTGILMHSLYREKYPEEYNAIIRRFTQVFEQAYVRFLDLQKAEAQAKEAQIEAALERVRARTMAMHKSDELPETSFLLFQQVKELGEATLQNSIGIVNEETGFVELSTTVHGHHLPHTLKVPIGDPYVMAKAVAAWKAKRKSLKLEFEGQELKNYNEHRNSFFETKVNFPEDLWIVNIVFFSQGWLSFSSDKNVAATTVDLLKRFAAVFDLTYTRFADLQKAEAQAKEAQIEAALERVRARTMAMHKSDELAETAQLLYHEFWKLGINTFTCGYMFIDEVKNTQISWVVLPDGKLAPRIDFPLTGDHVLNERYKDWKEKKPIHVFELKGEANKEHHRFLSGYVPEFVVKEVFERVPDKIVFHCANFSNGYLLILATDIFSPDEQQIITRFAKVFDLTYRRFLDLQKAEAQAKESQVQLALERVRARTMAMHKSEELSETAALLFEQLKELGEEPERTAIGIINEEERVLEVWATQHGGNQMNLLFRFTIDEPHVMQKVYRAWKEKRKSIAIDLQGKELEEYYQFLKNYGVPVNHDAFTTRRVEHFAAFSKGMLCIITSEPRPPEAIELYERFASVFDLTYTRFLDLQKAEAQAKEAQIQLALERVRARTMAMQRSDELPETSHILFQQMKELGEPVEQLTIGVVHEENNVIEVSATLQGNVLKKIYLHSIDEPYVMNKVYNAWKNQQRTLVVELKAKELNAYNKYRNELTNSEMFPTNLADDSRRIIYAAFFSKGMLALAANDPRPPQALELLERFASVFDLTYTRFLDLKKAEAQAREARIEASLEKVRARAMAMHKSDELAEVVALLYKQFEQLDFGLYQVLVSIYDVKNNVIEWWSRGFTDADLPQRNLIPIIDHPFNNSLLERWKAGHESYTHILESELKKSWEEYLFTATDLKHFPQQVKDAMRSIDKVFLSDVFMKYGSLQAAGQAPLPNDKLDILKRFTKVLDLAYTRMIDLQKAETQAKEARIEAGLERVRARTMAMHNSEDVSTATATMFKELEKLEIEPLRGGITIIKPDQTQEVWGINNLPEGRAIRSIGVFDMRLHPLWQQIYKARENNMDFAYYWLAGKDKEHYIGILNSTPNYLKQPIKDFPDVHVHSYIFGEGAIWTNSLEPHSDEQKQIMKRFASVFSLTFRRYLDLQKAEAQAKEAHIEAGLERVRAKAMAMHDSQDLADTIGVFYRELKSFSITPRRCGVGLLDEENRIGELFTWNTTEQGESLELVGRLKMEGHPILEGVYDHWITQTEYHPVLRGSEIKEYYKIIRPQMSFPDYEHDQAQYGYFFFFKEGGVYAWTEKEMKEDELQIYRRFTSVLSLTYKRYKDLKQAEASAKEAVRQASLDRVRAEIASMRTVEDLQRITPVIWNELMMLDIPFIRCGIFIMDDAQKLAHTFLSTPDGKAIASFHLPYDTPGNIGLVISNWRNKKQYIDHWDEEEFHQFAEILVQQGALSSAEHYLKTIPRGGFYLHFLPFLQGMLYVGNTSQLNDE